jgi:hypothetical protein
LRTDRKSGVRWRSRSTQQQERWTLLISPEQLTLADIYRCFAFAPAPQSPLATRVDRMVERDLTLTLADYFAAPDAKRNSDSTT